MRTFEVEKDGQIFLVVDSYHYIREGIGDVDLLAIDYSENMGLRILTATECTFLGFKDDIDRDLAEKLKGKRKTTVENSLLPNQ